ARALLRVPALRRHPARRLGREAQARPLHLAAGEDAVAGAQVLVELGGRDFLRPRVAQLGGADGVDREAAQRFAHVAVGVDIPVAAVVHQALRRDLALGLAVVLAVVVSNPEARAPYNCGRDHAEMRAGMLGGRAAALGLEDADALLDVLPPGLAAEDGAQALPQRPDVRLEEAGLQLGEERVHAEERVRLAGVEPQARQFVARARARLAEAVAVRLAVVLDRRVEAVLHVLEVALERRRRNPEGRSQGGTRNRPAILQELVDLVEALETFHPPSSLKRSKGK